MQHVYAVSDGTGRTALRTLDAAMTQFPHSRIEIHVRSDLRSADQVVAVVREAQDTGGFIVHTVATRPLRDAIIREARLKSVQTIDLMGPMLARLSEELSDSPMEKPGLFYELNRSYFQRIEAMEFAFRHDDGQRIHDVINAEIVLVGVSRTFKTPLSMYLAFKGWLVANVPIIPGMKLPAILDEMPEDRVLGLTTTAASLARIRQTRHHYLGGVTEHYVDPERVRMELMHARALFRKRPGWTVINVTNKPIEEIASEILDHKGKHSVHDDLPPAAGE